jgi:hypothetical protein
VPEHGRNGAWIGQAGRLEQDVVECALALHQLLDGCDARVLYATT